MCVGFATDRGGTPQQYCTGVFAEDNIGTSDTYRWNDDDIVLRLVDAAGAVDLEATFVEFTTTTFVLNWTNLHTTGSVRINYMVLGGADLEDAQAHSFSLTTGAGAFDVTLGSGFGHPNLVLFMRCAEAADSGVIAGADIGLGFGVLAGDDRSVWWGSQDNAATEATFQRIDNDSALVAGANGTIETDFVLAAEAGFPTDGYEVTKATSSFAAEGTAALALKFSSNVTIAAGGGSMRTTTGDTDLAVGTSTPKGLILLHTRQTTAGSTDTTSSDAAEIGVGLVDGAGNERWAGVWDDDGQATASVASSAQVDDKALRVYTPSTDALDGEADCTISGSNFRLTTTDAFSAAFLYQWVAVGEAGTGPITVDITPATETDTAEPLRVPRLTAATETDTAVAVDLDKTVTLTAAAETDTAEALDTDKQVTLTPTASTETAQALSVTKTIVKDLAPATETGEAQTLSVTHTHFVTLTSTVETDVAVDLTFTQPGGPIDITPAVETDEAVALTWTKTIFVTVTPASETGAAQALDTDKTVTISPASESCSATALSVTHVHYRTLSPAVETSEAVALSYVAGFLPSATISITLTDRPTRVTVRDQTAAQVQDRAHLVLREHA